MADNDTLAASPTEATQHEPAGQSGMPSTPSTDASASTTEAPSTSSANPAAAHASGGDAGADDAGADDAGDDAGGDDGEGGDDAGGSEEGASAEGGAGGEGGPKKRKRRRRKKKGGTSAGTEAAPTEGGDDAARAQQPRKPQAPRKDPSQVPFGRFFEGAPGSRRNAFSIGEVVAGRVTRTEYGTILVDLFGKAIAVVDEHEPREVQMPPPAAEKPASEAAATDASETPAEASSESTVEAAASADAAVETPTAAEPVAEAIAAEAPAAEASGADVDHDDGGGEHEDAGTLAAPIAPDEPPPPLPSIGEIFRGRVGAVAESGHLAIVNRLVDLKAARKRVDQAREDRTRVLGLVYGFNRGGFDVLVDGLRAFCPASGMSLGPVDDPAEFVGRKLEFSVPPAKAGTHGLVVSRRAILEREARKQARERAKTLQLGERVRGTVTQVRDFGLFIDIGGGLEGMVHVSEMSWDRSQTPADVARVGDVLEAQIIRLPDRKEKKERHERIGLSLKAVAADPWDAHGDAVAEGRVFKGRITRVAEFGAFVEVAPGVEGLLHVSELGTNLQHARDGAKEGDEVWVLIERADKKARRLSLSKLSPANVASLESGELTPESFKGRAPKQGASLKVIVDRVESHGLFVQIEGVLGRKGRGYIPNAEMATERGTDHRRKFPVGTKLDAKIIGTDRDGGLKLSRKALLQDEEKRAVQDYRREASKQGLGTFGDLLRARLGEKG
jgi:small subunit ribosomal protein S1